jgi:hypothetical protein
LLAKVCKFFRFSKCLKVKFGYLAQFCLVIWRNSVWLFGAILFGCLAQFCLVIWRNSIWLFGVMLFGCLAQFCLVIWRNSVWLFVFRYGEC